MKEKLCICGCGEPALYASRHLHRRFQGLLDSTDYTVEDRGYSTPCWIWAHAIGTNGYARIRIGNRNKQVHRVAYERYVGPIPDGYVIDHLCFQRACLNPDHLRVTTVAENARRKRDLSLSDAAVRHIRDSGLPTSDLSRIHNVSQPLVLAVQRGDVYSHVASETPFAKRPVGRPRILSPEQETEIRSSEKSIIELAAQFDVSTETIRRTRIRH